MSQRRQTITPQTQAFFRQYGMYASIDQHTFDQLANRYALDDLKRKRQGTSDPHPTCMSCGSYPCTCDKEVYEL